MPSLFWDASGLAKRYSLEVGSDVVNALFQDPSIDRHYTTLWNFAETFSILVRKRNRGDISDRDYVTASSSLRVEMLDGPSASFFEVIGADILSGLPLIAGHNLNAADASILAMLLRIATEESSTVETLVLVACDQRFLRASKAEGLRTLDPESLSVVEALALVGGL